MSYSSGSYETARASRESGLSNIIHSIKNVVDAIDVMIDSGESTGQYNKQQHAIATELRDFRMKCKDWLGK